MLWDRHSPALSPRPWSLLVTCDHGRGDNAGEWRSHNMKVNGAGYVWFAAIGPRIARGQDWSEHEPFLQGQIAATVAAAVGEDFAGANPKAAPPLPIPSISRP